MRAPGPDPAQRTDGLHGGQVRARLRSGSQDCQVAGMLGGEQPRGQAADRSGADGGDGDGVDQGHRAAVLALEQDDEALVRLDARAVVGGKTEMILTPMAGGLASTAGMAASADGTAAAGTGNDGAQRIGGLTACQPANASAIRSMQRSIGSRPRAVAPSMASMLRGACMPRMMT